MIALLHQTILSHNGYKVVHVMSIEEAKKVISSSQKIDAFIIDGNIIGGKTTELVKDIRKRYPDAKLVAASSDDDIQRELLEVGADTSAQKHEAATHLVTIIEDNTHPV